MTDKDLPFVFTDAHRELLHKSVKALLAQGVYAFNNGACRYSMVKFGSMVHCGVGLLIAPDLLPGLPEMSLARVQVDAEQGNPSATRILSALDKSGIATDRDTLMFLSALQHIHDHAADTIGGTPSVKSLYETALAIDSAGYGGATRAVQAELKTML